MTDNFDNLLRILETEPVMGDFHPMLPLCLPSDVEVISKAENLVYQLDDFSSHPVRPVIITKNNPNFADRFYSWDSKITPTAKLINKQLPNRIDYARNHMLTHQGIRKRIISDVIERDYQTVVLLLIDGLSYDDSLIWPQQSQPCFVDGPSITFSITLDNKIMPDVGLPAIIGDIPLARHLIDFGFTHSRGYSYWDRQQNDVSKFLFCGVPLKKVSGLSEAIELLSKEKFDGAYIQLFREGLDGLAHRRREVNENEVMTTINSIYQDFLDLVDLVLKSGLRGGIYLTSDHGIVWKKLHIFEKLPNIVSRHPRYSLEFDPIIEAYTSKFIKKHQNFYLFHFPYIGSKIRANDSGVHGGLSYWESFVPFMHIEVNT